MKNIIIPLAFIILYGCSNEDVKYKNNKSEFRTGNSGAYEISNVLAWAIPDQTAVNGTSLPDLQDYNRFKDIVNDIKSSPLGYEGSIIMLANGEQSLLENIEDDYNWKVSIRGPNVGASSIAFDSRRAIKNDIGPTYLRNNRFELTMLSCFSEGGTPTNARALYLAQYPGKTPILVTYEVSTGSAGISVVYQLHFGPMEWSYVPGAKDINYAGKSQKFAECPYQEFN